MPFVPSSFLPYRLTLSWPTTCHRQISLQNGLWASVDEARPPLHAHCLKPSLSYLIMKIWVHFGIQKHKETFRDLGQSFCHIWQALPVQMVRLNVCKDVGSSWTHMDPFNGSWVARQLHHVLMSMGLVHRATICNLQVAQHKKIRGLISTI